MFLSFAMRYFGVFGAMTQDELCRLWAKGWLRLALGKVERCKQAGHQKDRS